MENKKIEQQRLAGYFIRALDVVISLGSFLVLLPIFGIISMVLFCFYGRPVFYRQERRGKQNSKFYILKFRTMYRADDQAVQHSHMEVQRITRVGHLLRQTHLDELPQLLNVLKGEMSIVGPRPHALNHDADFCNEVKNYTARYAVKPGITGVAQAKGASGPILSRWMIRRRTALDEFWVKNYSVGLYFHVIFLTFKQGIKIYLNILSKPRR